MTAKGRTHDNPFCNITGRQCRHCSEEHFTFVGGYCVIKTGEVVKEKTTSILGQMCNCESKFVKDLDHCPLDDCVSPKDTWEETVEKKQKVGQQVLL